MMAKIYARGDISSSNQLGIPLKTKSEESIRDDVKAIPEMRLKPIFVLPLTREKKRADGYSDIIFSDAVGQFAHNKVIFGRH